MAVQANNQLATISATITLAMSLLILSQWSNSGVYASASDAKAYFEENIQESLALMSCEETDSFIQNHNIFKAAYSSSLGLPNQLNEATDCQEAKRIIHDVLAQSLETSGSGNGTADPQLAALPPFVCLACAAAACENHDLCLDCCHYGYTVPCYTCP